MQIPDYVKSSAAEIAMIYLGCEIAEEPIGSNRGFWVEMFQQRFGGKASWAWCMYFVQTCYYQAYARYPELLRLGGSPLAECPNPGHCYSVWQHAKESDRMEILSVAAIMAGRKIPHGAPYIRFNLDKTGHTGIVISHWQNDTNHELDIIKTIEGNSSNAIQRKQYFLKDLLANSMKGAIF